jgi:hypothetical protein
VVPREEQEGGDGQEEGGEEEEELCVHGEVFLLCFPVVMCVAGDRGGN